MSLSSILLFRSILNLLRIFNTFSLRPNNLPQNINIELVLSTFLSNLTMFLNPVSLVTTAIKT